MGWSYNQIDVYLSDKPFQLDEMGVSNSWTRVSTYGLLRDRPAIKSSTNNSDKITIPGRPGELYSVVEKRSNAQISFEILVGDIWPHASLKASQNPWLNNVLNRTYYLKSILDTTKRIAYCEPGKTASDYFEVLNTTCEITDSDEKATLIKVTMDVYPFRYAFDSFPGTPANTAYISLPKNDTYEDRTNFTLPYSDCNPIFITDEYNDSTGYGLDIRMGCYVDEYNPVPGVGVVARNPAYSDATFKSVVQGKRVIIDTNKLMAYTSDNMPVNRYLTGDYELLRIKGKRLKIRVTNMSGAAMGVKMYPRRGIVI